MDERIIITMKTILIVHMFNVSRKSHFESARCYGARLILLMKNPTWEARYVDRVLNVDTSSLNKVKIAALQLRREEHIDGVIPFTEHSVVAAAAAAHALGLLFITEQTALLSRNKYLMRKRLCEYQIPCPAFKLSRSITDAKNICNEFAYPIVIKPLIGGGSLAVYRINNETELINKYETLIKDSWEKFKYDPLYEDSYKRFKDAVLIESYIPGDEISVEAITVAGKTTVLGIHDKRMPMEGLYFEEIYSTTPSQLPSSTQNEVKQITQNANLALGINMGATHTEFRINDQGRPIILEVGARIGGGGIYKSILASTGIDMVHCIMDTSIGKLPVLNFSEIKPIGEYGLFSDREGVITEISGVDEIESDPDIIELILYKNVGDRVYLPPNSICHGHFVVKGNSIAEIDQHVQTILSKLQITVIDS
jgi:biotin carboxylase